MENRFREKVALVTGSAGGIGEAVSRMLSSQGATVIGTDRDSPTNGDLNDSLTAFIAGDLCDPAFCDSLPEQIRQQCGRLDVVVNNAGIMRRGSILDTSDEDWSITMQVNVAAVFRICRAAIPLLADQGGGTIVNVSSCWGIYPGPAHVAYCTSKAAVAAMTKCLGRDHASDGIRINAVCPNEVNTPMLRTGFEIRGLDPDSAIEELNRSVPLGHIADPEEIAETICWLASPESSYVCGALLEVNGSKPVY